MHRLTTVAPPTFFAELFPFVIFGVPFITLTSFEIISQNLAHIQNMTGRFAEINNGYSTDIFC